MTSANRDGHPAIDSEAGFSLVEVLVALVVIALLTVAVGSLIAFAVELKTRTETAQRLGGAVAQLEAFRNLLIDVSGRAADISIAGAHPESFELAGSRPGAIYLLVKMTLATTSTPQLLAVHFGKGPQARVTTVDLSAFDGSSIDYLSRQGDGLVWARAESVRGAPLASRLTVSYGTRQWSILLWVVPRDASAAKG
jgi:prepilin-type N-terminal cleavage/methylation domain-containing protein